MNPLEAALRRIAEDLAARGPQWALVGGLAVSARAEPRTTRDVDIAVGVEGDDEAEALLFELQQRGYQVLNVIEQTATSRLATARTVPPGTTKRGVVVDLLFASSGVEQEIAGAAEPLEIIAGFSVPVARMGHLIATKVLARDDRARPQDWDDLRALVAESSPPDLHDARDLLALIEQRGFNRGRSLLAAFDQVLVELASLGR
jgi:predicted nucleotidyltransferase